MLIFDKSFLQSLSVDESVWLDNFFLNNITPLFFAETLADLEKQVHSSRTPEQVVGNLALKTPDMQPYPCAHHTKLIHSALMGSEVPMDGRVSMDSGTIVALDGKLGTFIPATQEEEALQRWHKHEFLDIERQIAKNWRRQLCNVEHDAAYNFFQRWFLIGKPKNIDEVRRLALAYIDGSPQEASLRFGMALFGISPEIQQQVIGRWKNNAATALRDFCPYFHYVYCVDLFFNLAVASDLISRVRPEGRADNKVDIAYLYNLPLCSVFTSSDNLHERVVPLFLRDDLSFVRGRDLKDDLRKLDDYYSLLPLEIKRGGLHKFAKFLPNCDANLLLQLRDKHLLGWKAKKDSHVELTPESQQALMAQLKRIETESVKSATPAADVSMKDLQFAQMNRTVVRRKGKWDRSGPDAK